MAGLHQHVKRAYAGCNPTNFIDPTGLFPLSPGCTSLVVDAVAIGGSLLAGRLGGTAAAQAAEFVISKVTGTASIVTGLAGDDSIAAGIGFVESVTAPAAFVPGVGQAISVGVTGLSAAYSLYQCATGR